MENVKNRRTQQQKGLEMWPNQTKSELLDEHPLGLSPAFGQQAVYGSWYTPKLV